MSRENHKDELKKAHPNSRLWHERVNKMSQEQAAAIYIRLKAKGKLGK